MAAGLQDRHYFRALSGIRPIVLALVVSGIVACGGPAGAPQTDIVPDPPTTPVNTPPEINGIPPLSVVEGTGYAFTPVAGDADNDRLTFLIVNQPGWANFDGASGSLTGTPGGSDIGLYSGIIISVSDGLSETELPAFSVEVLAKPLSSVTVYWDRPSLNADGTALNDLAGFRVHVGSASGSYDSVIEVADPDATSQLVEDLAPGTYFFAVTAYDDADNSSDYSTEVVKVIQP